MREQGIFLKNGIDMPLVCRDVADLDTVEIKLALIGRFESADIGFGSCVYGGA